MTYKRLLYLKFKKGISLCNWILKSIKRRGFMTIRSVPVTVKQERGTSGHKVVKTNKCIVISVITPGLLPKEPFSTI